MTDEKNRDIEVANKLGNIEAHLSSIDGRLSNVEKDLKGAVQSIHFWKGAASALGLALSGALYYAWAWIFRGHA